MFFSAEDEGTLLEWLSKLAAASADTEKSKQNIDIVLQIKHC